MENYMPHFEESSANGGGKIPQESRQQLLNALNRTESKINITDSRSIGLNSGAYRPQSLAKEIQVGV